MKEIEHDSYVYPGTRFTHCGAVSGQGQGMSLRDAAALAALPAIIKMYAAGGRTLHETAEQYFARRAWRVADAFIAARETGET